MILVASNKPTHPIMISKIHVTLPFTSSDFPPYRFPPTALFNLGRLRAFSVPQEASSEHLLAPPATWEVVWAGPTSITASNPKVDGFLLQELPREHPLRMVCEKILSQIKSKIWDIHQNWNTCSPTWIKLCISLWVQWIVYSSVGRNLQNLHIHSWTYQCQTWFTDLSTSRYPYLPFRGVYWGPRFHDEFRQEMLVWRCLKGTWFEEKQPRKLPCVLAPRTHSHDDFFDVQMPWGRRSSPCHPQPRQSESDRKCHFLLMFLPMFVGNPNPRVLGNHTIWF